MDAEFARIGMEVRYFTAVDAATTTDQTFAATFAATGPLGALGRGDMACTLSHFALLEAFLETDADYALALEDDAVLAADLPRWLSDVSWVPEDADIVKLERFEAAGLVVLLAPERARHLGRRISRILSRHSGTAGYLITRAAARRVLDAAHQVALPIDHFLFNANASPLAATLTLYQIEPALVRQKMAEISSDVAPLRRDRALVGWAKKRRDLKRGYYEIRRLPVQVWQMLARGARLRAIDWQDKTGN